CARPSHGASGTSAFRRWRAVSAVSRGDFVSPHCRPVSAEIDTGRPLNLAIALSDRSCSDRMMNLFRSGIDTPGISVVTKESVSEQFLAFYKNRLITSHESMSIAYKKRGIRVGLLQHF
ncbi:unnamed protein product, partial [Ixodes hexagonus]